MVLNRMPETMKEAKDYAAKTFDIANLAVGSTDQLSPVRDEPILRPVVEDDEMPLDLYYLAL
jgi:hypothetical protein